MRAVAHSATLHGLTTRHGHYDTQPFDVHSDGEYLHVPTVSGQCSLLCNYIYNYSKKISETSDTTPARTREKVGNALC